MTRSEGSIAQETLEIVVQMGKIPRKGLGLYSNFWRVTIKN
jgi:hypothetical protein